MSEQKDEKGRRGEDLSELVAGISGLLSEAKTKLPQLFEMGATFAETFLGEMKQDTQDAWSEATREASGSRGATGAAGQTTGQTTGQATGQAGPGAVKVRVDVVVKRDGVLKRREARAVAQSVRVALGGEITRVLMGVDSSDVQVEILTSTLSTGLTLTPISGETAEVGSWFGIVSTGGAS